MVHDRRAQQPESAGRSGPSRRSVLRYSAFAALAGPTLAGCSWHNSNGKGGAQIKVATPAKPVTWPIAADNKPIGPGLPPERNATLRLYNYPDYIAPDVIASFEKKYQQYGVTVQVSNFNNTNEALTAIRGGTVPFDLYFPGYATVGYLATSGLIRALNHSYLPAITQVWPQFQNPFYDGEWRYSIPYTIYTTGLAWRTDQVSEDLSQRPNPWDVFWDPKYPGKTAVLDAYRESISLALLRNGGTDLNTGDQAALAKAQTALLDLTRTTHPAVTVDASSDLPAGRFAIAHCWSGDVLNMPYYLPSGTDPGILRYWFPADDQGPVNNDLVVLLRSGKNPVLSHLFLDHLLDPDVALANFVFTGYQPPQITLTAEKLITGGHVPQNLTTAVAKPSTFSNGYRMVELPPAVDARWEAVWQRFKA